MKSSEDLKKWKQIEQEVTERYFYNRRGLNSIINYIHLAGHFHVARKLNYSDSDKVLEIGCGFGTQKGFLSSGFYVGLDIAFSRVKSALHHQDSNAHFLNADGLRLPFRDNSFTKAISIYNLEHISTLDSLFDEIIRVLIKEGQFVSAIPTEGSFLWNFGRKLTTERLISKRYKINYAQIVKNEHCNDYKKILKCLRKKFVIKSIKYLPFRLPAAHLNLVLVIDCVMRKSLT